MNIPSPLRIATVRLVAALGLAFASVAFAQSQPPAPPTSPADVPPAFSQFPVVTQSSRIRAFNAGPGGELRSLYLRNGSVVDVTPALGEELGAAVRKGEKITVTGTKSRINGQSLLEAASIQLNDQTFSANASSSLPPAPGALAQGAVPSRLGTPQAPPPVPSPRRRNKAAASAPCGVSVSEPPPPDFGGPPPLDGMAPPPPPDGMAPPPPPLD
jgi:hypothetical protein